MSNCRNENLLPLHVVFLPYLAPGHMLPMVEIARLFASKGVKVTIVTTPINASRFLSIVDKDVKSGNHIAFHTIALPSKEVGLPEGCENLISAPTPEITIKLFKAIEMLRPKIENLFAESKLDCIISDVLYPWTAEVAEQLGIPRLAFSGSGFFNSCVAYCVDKYQPHKDIESESEEFFVPTLPDEVLLTRSQLPDLVKGKTGFDELFQRLKEAERKSFGVLINSFYELEPAYADYYRNKIGIRSWHIGPVSIFNKSIVDDTTANGGGDETAVGAHGCLSWLDGKEPGSVLYACFGSLTRFTESQLTEMASALEDSGIPFIWVVGKVLKKTEERGEEGWQPPDGFEERMKDTNTGLVIRGWVPQTLILEHPAIGGFMTHCGWNSILEGVSAGIPLITWPIFAEQFYNEKLVTQVLKLGIPVGNLQWKVWATEESPMIEREKIKMAIRTVMGGGNDGEEMRSKAKSIGQLAKKAVQDGGSSYNNLKTLIEDIKLYNREKHEKDGCIV